MSYLASLGEFLQYEFLWKALLGTIALAIATGMLSPIVVTKRYSFMGAAVGHSTILGLAIGILLFPHSPFSVHFIVTLGVTLLFAMILARSTLEKDLPSDSLIGIFFSVMMALGIIIFSFQSDSSENLLNFLFGNILLLEYFDIITLIVMSLIILLVIGILFRQWIYFIFDPVGATLKGIPIKIYHYLLFAIMTATIVTAVKLAGTILVTTLLIMPGVFAIKTQKGTKAVFIASTFFALITTIFGLTVANWLNTPSGATLSLIQFVALSMLFIKNRFTLYN